ncbi:unnamed protein product [Prorocentrum cordatum]|uniref:Thioredoxin domain-containing protein n=1 Tax=Prorocentrum cordatum TaxID=2364126 RepID=A0ABN9TJM7_9DINO|nr:unnamed protein product [Polarella glacialis]
MDRVDFEAQVINGTTGPAWVAMLYANWCGHCHHYAPIFIKHAEAFEHDSRVKFAACDCAQYIELCMSLGVHSYPTLRGFRFVPRGDHEGKSTAEIARVGEEVPREVQTWVHARLGLVGIPGVDGSARQAEARAAAIGDGGLAAARAAPPLDAWVQGSAPAKDDQAGLRLVDAEVAVLFSLRQGTFLKGEAVAGSPVKAFIQGKVLDELCTWLEFLAAALPSVRASADLKAFLSVALAAQTCGGLSAVAWSEVLDKRWLGRAPPEAG